MLRQMTTTVAITISDIVVSRLFAMRTLVVQLLRGQCACYQAMTGLFWPDRLDRAIILHKPCESWLIRRSNCSLFKRYRLSSVTSGTGATMVG